MSKLPEGSMALREENSALQWAATPPQDNTPTAAVAAGHFVQVGNGDGCRGANALGGASVALEHARTRC